MATRVTADWRVEGPSAGPRSPAKAAAPAAALWKSCATVAPDMKELAAIASADSTFSRR
jgi:hypothetical protein